MQYRPMRVRMQVVPEAVERDPREPRCSRASRGVLARRHHAFRWENRTMRVVHGVLAIAMVTLAACDRKPEAAQAPAAGTAGGMAGMLMAMQGMQMMPMMRAHLELLSPGCSRHR